MIISESISLEHVCYKDGDADAPPQIKDANGQITLALCKICGHGEAELTYENCIPTDSAIINWLESMHNLHTAVEVLYVVSGYQVYLTWDGEATHDDSMFEGATLREAYAKAMRYRYNAEKRRFEKVK